MDSEFNSFVQQQIQIKDTSIHLVEAGNKSKQTILFLHGYPENWEAFKDLMNILKNDYHVLAIDLPGIGKSEKINSSDKFSIAVFVKDLIEKLNLSNIILAGHDCGGMITYSFIRHFANKVSKAIIMNTAIPGVEPWEEVKRNPHIWHFAFYAVPNLPENLIEGKQRLLFDYFFDTLPFIKNVFDANKRERYVAAYADPLSLKTSFDWYRSFPEDEKENSTYKEVSVPVLYLKGDKDFGDIEDYVKGFRKNGLKNIQGKIIANSGHFASEEQPEEVAITIDNFISN
ncbi:alpha/beta fold hydrolase [Flavobacterium pectinovorum]|uniref:Alpha/beta hydrolase n=1 Tax=Flavobacterium pectinovorum TaxID=29533 RepID=A0A502E959_9FLAO|nr:alpha/beta hydrolase [Flavobacterium pectinovorum]TPG33937.1 alpha/beta hydrolase [Flavobacterium pectinovorum]